MKKKLKWITSLMLIMGLMFVTACSGNNTSTGQSGHESSSESADRSDANQSDEKFQWRLIAITGEAHPENQIFRKHLKQLEEDTNGRLSIELFSWGEVPYAPADGLSILKEGQIEIVSNLSSYVTGSAPILGGPDLAFLTPHSEDMKEKIKMADALWDSDTMKQKVTALFDSYNIIALGDMRAYWPQNLFVNRPVNTAGDLKGLSVRTYSAEGTDLLNAVGANPISVAVNEVFTALQTNTLGGVVTALYSMDGLGWGDALNQTYMLNFTLASTFFTVNKDKWNSLPPDLQEALERTARNIYSEWNNYIVEQEDKEIKKLEDKYNFTTVWASEGDYGTLRNLAKEHVWPKWAERTGGDANQVLAEIMKIADSFSNR